MKKEKKQPKKEAPKSGFANYRAFIKQKLGIKDASKK